MRMIQTVAAALAALLALPATAGSVPEREGWAVHDTDLAYDALLERTRAAIRSEGMYLVTEAGPTGAAKRRGIDIPGNRVLGVYRNDYAVRAVRLSVAAMIEAPIRVYVTEDADGTATLSYKTPSHVFAPYVPQAGPELAKLGEELDSVFAAIAAAAIAE